MIRTYRVTMNDGLAFYAPAENATEAKIKAIARARESLAGLPLSQADRQRALSISRCELLSPQQAALVNGGLSQ